MCGREPSEPVLSKVCASGFFALFCNKLQQTLSLYRWFLDGFLREIEVTVGHHFLLFKFSVHTHLL